MLPPTPANLDGLGGAGLPAPSRARPPQALTILALSTSQCQLAAPTGDWGGMNMGKGEEVGKDPRENRGQDLRKW